MTTGTDTSCIAVIPARGGSKRIPKKNIRPFRGRPAISYAIDTARRSGLFSMVIVSTDSDEIAALAEESGAECPFKRPADLSGDDVPLLPVLRHAIAWCQQEDQDVEFACLVMSTAVLLTSEYLIKGHRELVESGSSCALGVTTYAHPVQRALSVSDDGRLQRLFPEYFELQSNELPEAYHDAAQFCWFRVSAGVHLEDAVPPRDTIPISLPRLMAQDIDTLEDWYSAELAYDVLHATNTRDWTK